jgi:ABC-type transport system involved in Fe-S cluster assembly fused permease/ATPase subunit
MKLSQPQRRPRQLHLMAGRTSFVIAHRLITIREADELLVINNGKIDEHGNHAQLLANKGFLLSFIHEPVYRPCNLSACHLLK